MKIVEFRVIVPVDVNQYSIGNLYMNMQYAKDEKKGNEGIEIKENKPYERDNEKGQYTYKIYHIKSQIPGFIRWAVPDKYLHFHEVSYNSYPHYDTQFTVPGMGKDFVLKLESQHLDYTSGMEIPDNCLSLTQEELAERKIVYLNIINGEPVAEPKNDIHGFVCPEAGINEPIEDNEPYNPNGPPAWTKNFKGKMTLCVKLVRFEFHWRGLQSAVERFVINSVYPGVFTNSHRIMMKSLKDWCNMTMDDIRNYENGVQRDLNNSGTFEQE